MGGGNSTSVTSPSSSVTLATHPFKSNDLDVCATSDDAVGNDTELDLFRDVFSSVLGRALLLDSSLLLI